MVSNNSEFSIYVSGSCDIVAKLNRWTNKTLDDIIKEVGLKDEENSNIVRIGSRLNISGDTSKKISEEMIDNIFNQKCSSLLFKADE